MDEKNIAALLRDYIGEYTRNEIAELYPHHRTLDTKKGIWQIHERESFAMPFLMEEDRTEPKDGFCAVYYNKKGESNSLFRGDLNDRRTVDTTIDEASKNVIEQRRFFAWPPKGLTPREGRDYFVIKGGLATIGSALSAMPIFYFSGNGGLAIGIQVGGIFLFMGGSGLIGEIFGKKIGEAADKRRVKNFPNEAFSYLYGEDARNAIYTEHRTLQDETRKTRLYQELRKAGYDVSKPFTKQIYDAMQSMEKHSNVIKLTDYLKHQKEPKVPLETAVKAYKATR